jgi:hypothetical protein
MITDGEWMDYDNDKKPDLVLTGEYMPIRIFHNEGGAFKEITRSAGLQKTNGWWNRLVITDINKDGYPDIIAGNHGLNSRFKATEEKPVSMYVSDFDDNGSVEQIVTCFNKDSSYPMILRHDLVGILPYLKNKYLKYENYKEQTMQDIFTPAQLSKALKLDAYEMRSCVFINNKNGTFTKKALPLPVQVSPMYGICVEDVDGDGNMDILMGGNFYESKPEVGIYDASYGAYLKGDGQGNFIDGDPGKTSIHIRGPVRDILTINTNREKLVLFLLNNSSPVIYRVTNNIKLTGK